MEGPERGRDPLRHLRRGQRRVGHRRAGDELEDGGPQFRHDLHDPRPDAHAGGGAGVVQLVLAIDGQQVGLGPGDAHDEGRAIHPHEVVVVGQAARQQGRLRRAAAPGRDGGDDLLDRHAHSSRPPRTRRLAQASLASTTAMTSAPTGSAHHAPTRALSSALSRPTTASAAATKVSTLSARRAPLPSRAAGAALGQAEQRQQGRGGHQQHDRHRRRLAVAALGERADRTHHEIHRERQQDRSDHAFSHELDLLRTVRLPHLDREAPDQRHRSEGVDHGVGPEAQQRQAARREGHDDRRHAHQAAAHDADE